MKTYLRLAYMAVIMTLTVACNEKISPELLQGNSSGGIVNETIPPTEYSFSVKNSSSVLLNYALHKQGAGNYNQNCEIKNEIGFSSEYFIANREANDITCMFEAEEMNLYSAGFQFDINASKESCEYVGYSPFGYFDSMPGDSTSTYFKVTCGDGVDNSNIGISNLANINFYNEIDLATVGQPLCNQVIFNQDSTSLPQQWFLAPESDTDFCRFKYENKNCDIGTVTIKEVSITRIENEDGSILWEKNNLPDKKINCGGKIYNCVSGPVKEAENNTGFTKYTNIYDVVHNQDFTKTFSYGGLRENSTSARYRHSLKYANFRRNLASKEIDFISSVDNLYNQFWSPYDSNNKQFHPDLVEKYAQNKNMDGTTLVTEADQLEDAGTRDQPYWAKPLAAEAFVGLSSKVNPFYTFYCFDEALEVKARIRMMVREWDRIYSIDNNEDFDLLSDLAREEEARMDSFLVEEIPEPPNGYFLYNDLGDWDDIIPMTRTNGPYDPSTTLWSPLNLWFSDLNFETGWYNDSE